MELMTDRQVAKKCGISRSSVWLWAKLGLLPEPIRIGRRTTRWRSDEIEAAIERMQQGATDEH